MVSEGEKEGGEQHFGEEVRWCGMTRETKLWKGIMMIYEESTISTVRHPSAVRESLRAVPGFRGLGIHLAIENGSCGLEAVAER